MLAGDALRGGPRRRGTIYRAARSAADLQRRKKACGRHAPVPCYRGRP